MVVVISITFVGAQGSNLIGDGVKERGVLFRGFIFEVLEESVGEGGLGVHGFNGLVQCLAEVMEHGLVAFFDPDFKFVHGSVELVLERDLHLLGFRAQCFDFLAKGGRDFGLMLLNFIEINHGERLSGVRGGGIVIGGRQGRSVAFWGIQGWGSGHR